MSLGKVIIPIIDDVVETDDKNKLQSFLKEWLNEMINNDLGSLLKLKDIHQAKFSCLPTILILEHFGMVLIDY